MVKILLTQDKCVWFITYPHPTRAQQNKMSHLSERRELHEASLKGIFCAPAADARGITCI